MPIIANSGLEPAATRIDLGETADFDLGGLCVSPAHREVRLNGKRRELEPKVAQVLVALAAVRPQVVSRDRLIEQGWDGRVVGDDALNRCIDRSFERGQRVICLALRSPDFGRRGIKPKRNPVGEVSVAAEALKRVGRTADANKLLGQAEVAVRAVYPKVAASSPLRPAFSTFSRGAGVV